MMIWEKCTEQRRGKGTERKVRKKVRRVVLLNELTTWGHQKRASSSEGTAWEQHHLDDFLSLMSSSRGQGDA
jgi:hypothetical protein